MKKKDLKPIRSALRFWSDNLDNVPCAAYLIKNDANLTLRAANSSFYRLFACSENDMAHKYGNRFGALLSENSLSFFSDYAKNSRESGEILLQIKRKNIDAWIHTEIIENIFDDSGDASFFCCFSFDVTEREQKIRILSDEKKIVRFITNHINLDFFEYNPETKAARIYYAHTILNQSFTNKAGLCPDFPEQLLSRDIIHPEFKSIFREIFASVPEGGKRSCELCMNSPNGSALWIRLTLISDTETPKTRLAGIIEDITVQKESSRSYLNETQFYQAMLSEKDAWAQVDVTDDRIMRIGGIWNLYNELIASKPYSELTSEVIRKIVHHEDWNQYLELMQRSNLTDSLHNGIDKLGCEFRRIVEQNKMVWMQLHVHLFFDPFTKHIFALMYLKNIDDRKKMELRLLRQSAPPDSTKKDYYPSSLSVQEKLSPDDFDDLVSRQGDIAYLVNPDTFELLHGNKAFYDRIGLTSTQCVGLKCYETIQKREIPCPFCSKANWSRDKFFMWKNQNSALEQEFLIKNKLVLWKGEEVMLALAIDISNNKSIADSLTANSMESSGILSGVQRMSAAETLPQAMTCALEAVGIFFKADTVRFWQRSAITGAYECAYYWEKENNAIKLNDGKKEINAWLDGMEWREPIMLENPEAMLCFSYDMYQYMKNRDIRNQRWMQVSEKKEEFGCIAIDNVSRNFQNIAFLESFSVFIAGELKKRNLLKELQQAAKYDDLTGLLSRRSFEEYIGDYKPDDYACVGVLIANFNNLKGINSDRGFNAGNYYIKQFADMLREIFNESDVFRLNGDEFLVISVNTPADILDEKLRELGTLIDHYDFFSISAGQVWDDVEKDLPVLIEQATQVMKLNKNRHKDKQKSEDSERRKMLSGLITSIENCEFEIFLQPKVDLNCGTISGAEALIRYHDKKAGIIPPSKFIEILEKNNLIRYIDLFVLEEVFKLHGKWRQHGIALPVISLNFSRLTLLERGILDSVNAISSRYKMSDKLVEIEITESIAGISKNILFEQTAALTQAGFSISLDDFGTKYTNLSLLADIEFSVLKLDKSLVSALEERQEFRLILKNVIQMCRDLGISIIAEGVERKEQETILRDLGCRFAQGYLYGKPVPVREFETRYLQQRA